MKPTDAAKGADVSRSPKLRVMAEYSSSGIWVIGGGPGPFRHGMIEHGALRLPLALAQRFDDWIEAYETLDDAGTTAFNLVGLQLATELKQIVGRGVYVEFVAEACGGGLGETISIP
jgi:hypothetical protein